MTSLPQEDILVAGMKQSPDAVLIEDQKGLMLYANPRFVDLWHLSTDEKSQASTAPYVLRQLPSTVRNADSFLSRVNYLYDHMGEESHDVVEFTDGGFFESYTAPLALRDQKDMGRIWYFHDITAHKQAETQLRTEKETLERYFEVIGRIVLVIAPNGTILYLNDRGHMLLGYPFGELIGKNWITDVLSRNQNYTLDIFLESVTHTKGESAYFEYSLVTKSGKEVYITWGSTPIKDELGQIQSYLCTGEDISDLKKAEIDIFHLKELDKLKDEFLNIAAHELKTPLTSIIALSDLLRNQKSQLPELISAYPDIIFEEGMRLKSVVNRVLTVTRYESGKAVTHLEHIAVNAFISSLLPVLQTLNQKKKYTIQLHVLPEEIDIETDKEQISEVIINFVDNAVKYGKEGQTITISVNRVTTTPATSMVSVEVADEGQGIPPESLPKLFNKFSQLEPSLSRSQEGTGLGLYICKLIVERLGGKIEAKSEVGKGSKFTFYLPIKSQAMKPLI